MHRLILSLAPLTMLAIGCQSAVFSPAAVSSAPVAMPIDAIGQHVEVQVASDTAQREVTYRGQLSAVNTDTVVLSSATVETRHEQGVPIVRRMPFTSRLFRNVGVGRETLNGDVTIRRADIETITVSEDEAFATADKAAFVDINE